MKYIITEEQNERLEKTMMEFFDKNLTPFEGWESHEDYESELEINGGELFLRTTDDDEWDLLSNNHMWYSICNNDKSDDELLMFFAGLICINCHTIFLDRIQTKLL